MFKPSSRLQTIYRTYNRKYFDGELPDIQVGFNELDGLYATLAVSVWTSEEDGLEHTMLQIHVDPAKHFGAEQLRATVLHEMAHVKCLPDRHHGKKFKEEMTRLFLRGAFWGLI
jgi:SprT-like family